MLQTSARAPLVRYDDAVKFRSTASSARRAMTSMDDDADANAYGCRALDK